MEQLVEQLSSEDVEAVQTSKKAKIQEANKQTWLFTYTASSPDISASMLHQNGIKCDECYSVQWRESKYTLIHCNSNNKVRSSKLKKTMASLEIYCGIKQSFIVGYDSLSSNEKAESSIQMHPGFKRMVHALNQHPNELRSWLSEGELATNKRGLLWRYIESTDPKQKTRGQLVTQIIEQAPMIENYKAIQAENESLKAELALRGVELSKAPPSTRAVLFGYRKDKDARNIMSSVTGLEKRLNKTASVDGSGEIYAAWNPTMKHLFKLGFTFQDAGTRVKALQTAGVLEPFTLVRHAHVAAARKYEKAMHIYFRDVRVYKRKEFFAATAEEITRFFDMMERDSGESEEKEQWMAALTKAMRSKQ